MLGRLIGSRNTVKNIAKRAAANAIKRRSSSSGASSTNTSSSNRSNTGSSGGSYAVDPQGRRHDTVVKSGKTYTTGGERIGSGWTSNTAGGIYKMGNDGVGVKVNSHNRAPNSGMGVYGKDYWYENNSVVRPGADYGDRKDPTHFTHVVARGSDGKEFTVHRERAQQYSDMGYDIVAPSKGAARWQREDAIRDFTPGKDWVDDGYNSGNIRMTTPDGRLASVNAREADKYFKDGYELDSRSQSILRALQSGKFGAIDSADSAITSGEYDKNADYSGKHGWDWNAKDGAGSYIFGDGDGLGFWNEFKDTIDEPPKESSVKEVDGVVKPEGNVELENEEIDVNPNFTQVNDSVSIEKNEDGSRTINFDGTPIELSEDDYINYMLGEVGLPPMPKKEEVEEVPEVNEEQIKADAEAKAIEAKLQAEKEKSVPQPKVNSFIDEAKKMTGWRYSQGKRFNEGYVDCSSLVGRAMKNAGITDNAQVTTRSIVSDSRFTKISKAEAKPGDIMWQKGHVGIKVGDNRVLEASGSKKKVIEQNLNNRFTHAYRINV